MSRKRTLSILGGVLMVTALSPKAEAAMGTARIFANMVPAISISRLADLSFGSVIPGTEGGAVILTAAGVRSAEGGVVLSGIEEGNQAVFQINGDYRATYVVTLPTVERVIDGNGNWMDIDAFSCLMPPRDRCGVPLLVGARLNVAPFQALGLYAGIFEVFVEYN